MEEELKEEIRVLKENLEKIKGKIETKEDTEIERLDKAVAKDPVKEQVDTAIKNNETFKEKENLIQKALKKKEPKKSVTYILIASKLLIFASFLWVSVAMFNIGQTINGVIILFAVALWLILDRLDKGV